MPVSYRIDTTQRMVFSMYSGVVTDAELITLQAQIRIDGAFDPSFGHLADFSAVERFAVQPETMHYIAAARASHPDAPRALVATLETTYTLMRLFQRLTEPAGDTVRVFTDLAAALAWLDQRAEFPEPKEERMA